LRPCLSLHGPQAGPHTSLNSARTTRSFVRQPTTSGPTTWSLSRSTNADQAGTHCLIQRPSPSPGDGRFCLQRLVNHLFRSSSCLILPTPCSPNTTRSCKTLPTTFLRHHLAACWLMKRPDTA